MEEEQVIIIYRDKIDQDWNSIEIVAENMPYPKDHLKSDLEYFEVKCIKLELDINPNDSNNCLQKY